MPVMSNLCAYAEVDNALLAETKTFNIYSETEGFDYPYPQYMSAVFLLRTCYDLLMQAGFKNIEKNEDEQSLTIWGLKLFFVNIAGNKNTVNIAGPGINFKYSRMNVNASGAQAYPMSSSTFPQYECYNHFLQYSLINIGNVYKLESSAYDYSGKECANIFYENIDDNGNKEYMLYVTLRCSNDGICFSTQIYNERQDNKGYQYPLFNIFKGRDILHNKDILVLGKKLERVPFVFSTPFKAVNDSITSKDNRRESYTASSSSDDTRVPINDFTNNNVGFFNAVSKFATSITGKNSSTPSNGVTASLDSALVCSGNNLIYYADDTYTQLEDTLYLDWSFNIEPEMILKGNAIANCGKYILYGINQLVIDIPVQSNYYYDIEDEKYWCMFNHLITDYVGLYNEMTVDTWKQYLDSNYFNKLAVHEGAVRAWTYRNSNNHTPNLYLSPTLDFLNVYTNSFGKMKKNIYEDESVLNADKKAWAVALNPAILMRIDDVITE